MHAANRQKPKSDGNSEARIMVGDLWIQPLNIPATISL
jgi:hypothetical protein